MAADLLLHCMHSAVQLWLWCGVVVVVHITQNASSITLVCAIYAAYTYASRLGRSSRQASSACLEVNCTTDG